MQILIIGGGAAGFFAAIACAEANPAVRVTILERGKNVLEKVRISGGGRCNVTHDCPDARELVKNYPRGSRELLAPFLRFGPADTMAWFERRGVRLKTEADGRMFPTTDDSATIVNCLINNAQRANVTVRTGARAERLEPPKPGNPGWRLWLTGEPQPILADKILVAAGSNTAVWDLLAGLGHRIMPPVPSLFTFNTKDTRLRELSGLSVPNAAVKIAGQKLAASGPLLVTHWGLSGPAVLRLSAWGARVLHGLDYRFMLVVNWLGDVSSENALEKMSATRLESGKKLVRANPQFGLPARLWDSLAQAAAVPADRRWADVDKKTMLALAAQLTEAQFQIAGKSTFKEEFVTAGGVALREVNFKTFESRCLPGLFLAGEVLDVDAITGGFNFQAAWTGGWIAGQAMAGLGDNTR